MHREQQALAARGLDPAVRVGAASTTTTLTQQVCMPASAFSSWGSVNTRWQYGTLSNLPSRAASQTSRWRQGRLRKNLACRATDLTGLRPRQLEA